MHCTTRMAACVVFIYIHIFIMPIILKSVSKCLQLFCPFAYWFIPERINNPKLKGESYIYWLYALLLLFVLLWWVVYWSILELFVLLWWLVCWSILVLFILLWWVVCWSIPVLFECFLMSYIYLVKLMITVYMLYFSHFGSHKTTEYLCYLHATQLILYSLFKLLLYW